MEARLAAGEGLTHFTGGFLGRIVGFAEMGQHDML